MRGSKSGMSSEGVRVPLQSGLGNFGCESESETRIPIQTVPDTFCMVLWSELRFSREEWVSHDRILTISPEWLRLASSLSLSLKSHPTTLQSSTSLVAPTQKTTSQPCSVLWPVTIQVGTYLCWFVANTLNLTTAYMGLIFCVHVRPTDSFLLFWTCLAPYNNHFNQEILWRDSVSFIHPLPTYFWALCI